MTDDNGVFSEQNAGALKFTRTIAADPAAQDQFDELNLFDNSELSDLRKKVREAGLSVPNAIIDGADNAAA